MPRILVLAAQSHSNDAVLAVAHHTHRHTFVTLSFSNLRFQWWNLSAWIAVRKAIRDFNPDVLHCVGLQALRVATVLNRQRKPFVYSSISFEEMDRPTRRFASKGVALVHIDAERDVFAHNGLNVERITLGIPETVPETPHVLPHWDGQVILFGGQLEAASDPRQAVWSFDCLKYALPSAELVFPGEGPMEAEIRKLSFGLGFDDYRVRFAPESERTAWIRRAGVVWLTRTQGGATEALSALAQGLPVLGMHTPELAEYAPEGLTLVPALDRIGLASATLKLFNRPRTSVPTPRFPFAAMVEKYAAVYDALAGTAA